MACVRGDWLRRMCWKACDGGREGGAWGLGDASVLWGGELGGEVCWGLTQAPSEDSRRQGGDGQRACLHLLLLSGHNHVRQESENWRAGSKPCPNTHAHPIPHPLAQPPPMPAPSPHATRHVPQLHTLRVAA